MYRNRISEAECQNRTNIRKHTKAMNSWVELHLKKNFLFQICQNKAIPWKKWYFEWTGTRKADIVSGRENTMSKDPDDSKQVPMPYVA